MILACPSHVLQAGRKEPTRYLLTETAAQGLAPARPVSSLPRVIEVLGVTPLGVISANKTRFSFIK